jgi:methionyl-tRNA formyltransferase
MDSGDIIIKNKINVEEVDTAQSLEIKGGQAGGELLSNILQNYVDGNIKLQKQDDAMKTICSFVKKEDGEIKIDFENITPEKILEMKNKWRAYYPWPGIFFFLKHKIHNEEKIIRVKINAFNLKENSLEKCIERVIPEGKKEISFEDFKRGYLTSK